MVAVGCALVAVGGFWLLLAGEVVGNGFTSAFEPRVGVDELSGLFLGVLGVCGAAVFVFAGRYLEPSGRGRAIASLTALFVLVQVLVLVARDPLTFLVAWEAMTLPTRTTTSSGSASASSLPPAMQTCSSSPAPSRRECATRS